MQEGLQTGTLSASARLRPWSYAITVVLLLLDRFLKGVALVTEPATNGGAIGFELYRNTGSIFSLPVPMWLLIALSGILFLTFLVLFVRAAKRASVAAPALLLIVLGAASNLYDRTMHGFVVDYVMLLGRAAINVADAMIFVGVLLLLLRDPFDGAEEAPDA